MLFIVASPLGTTSHSTPAMSGDKSLVTLFMFPVFDIIVASLLLIACHVGCTDIFYHCFSLYSSCISFISYKSLFVISLDRIRRCTPILVV